MKYEVDPKKITVKLKKSRSLLLKAFYSVPEDKWFDKVFDSKWSVDETLIHIVGWDELLLEQAKVWVSGSTPKEIDISDDEYNIEYLRTHEVESKKESINLFTKSTKSVLDFLNNLSPELVKYAIENESLVDLDLYSHDMEHYEETRKLFNTR